jgi:hypothetical protein
MIIVGCRAAPARSALAAEALYTPARAAGRGGRVAEGTRLLSEYGDQPPSRVRIPPSPLYTAPPTAPVAQLDRASVYGTEGQRFESSRARSKDSEVCAHLQALSRTVPGTRRRGQDAREQFPAIFMATFLATSAPPLGHGRGGLALERVNARLTRSIAARRPAVRALRLNADPTIAYGGSSPPPERTSPIEAVTPGGPTLDRRHKTRHPAKSAPVTRRGNSGGPWPARVDLPTHRGGRSTHPRSPEAPEASESQSAPMREKRRSATTQWYAVKQSR